MRSMAHLNDGAVGDLNGRAINMYRWSVMFFKYFNFLVKWKQVDRKMCEGRNTARKHR